MLLNGNDRLKLSQWALGYDQMRGQGPLLARSAPKTGDIRLSRHKDRGKLQYRSGSRRYAALHGGMMFASQKRRAIRRRADVIAAQKKRARQAWPPMARA